MFLVERKLEARIQEMAQYRYRDGIEIGQFSTTEDDGAVGAYPPMVKGKRHYNEETNGRGEIGIFGYMQLLNFQRNGRIEK